MRQEQQTLAQQMVAGRRTHLVLLILWLGVILGVSSWPNPQPPITTPSLLRQVLAPTAHFILYGVLGVLASWNLLRWAPGRVHTLVSVFMVCLFGFLWGMLDEWYQGFIPGRESSWGDVAVDTAGAFAGGMVARWLWGRRPAGQKVAEGAGSPLDRA